MGNTYVMFCFSHTVGGGQNYVNTKVKWLKKNGWKVIVFSTVESLLQGESPWDTLTEYEEYSCLMLNTPPEFCGKYLTEKTLNWMQSVIGEHKKVVIESHTDFFAEWGELLAARIRAKHICFLLDEQLEKYPNKEFLHYKYLRNEVAGIHLTSMKRLFEGYYDVLESPRYVLRAVHEGDVQNIRNELAENLVDEKYNIAYIGRRKQYCENIKKAIATFSRKHKEDTIHFIVVGDIGNVDMLLEISNVKVSQMGFLTPMPTALFDHIDVAIAGAGCARISAQQGVYTIVADAHTCLANGILGYTTQDVLFSETKPLKYEELLEDILIRKKYDVSSCVIERTPDVNEVMGKHLDFINNSDPSQNYFDFEKHPQPFVVVGKKNRLKRFLMNSFPQMVWYSFCVRRVWGKMHESAKKACK